MANINVKDLTNSNILGSDLFYDSESFIQDLSEYELTFQGGKAPRPTPPVIIDKIPAPTPPIFKLP